MKEEDLSRIKRYPIVEYLERKGIKPVRKTPTYAMYRSPLREETHPSFKVDTEKNLWIDYGEGRGGSIIDLCMRMEGCTLSEAFCCLKQTTSFDTACNNAEPSKEKAYNSNRSIRLPKEETANGTRRQIEVSDTLPPHFQEYLTKVRCINLEKAMPFLKCISYEARGRRYQAIGFANLFGGYELRDDKTFKGTIAPKDITPIFTDRAEPVCIFEGFMDFLSFLSMKEEITNHCLVMNSVSNVARTIRYLNDRHLTHIRAFLDNDEAGRKAVGELIRAGFKVEDMSVYYKNFKDLNEFHVCRVREQKKQKAQEQTLIPVTEQNESKKSKQFKHKRK